MLTFAEAHAALEFVNRTELAVSTGGGELAREMVALRVLLNQACSKGV